MKIVNQTKNSTIATHATVARTFLSRLCGLIPRESLQEGEALVITQCQSIHMFFMKFAIDVIFVDSENRVVGLATNLKPFSLSRVFWRASLVIELPVGVIARTSTSYGDCLELKEGF